ncbi:MAG TPA: hypothetical protein VKR52_18280 [Terracidiphilus sp.]|nr:hypothetical protein [Terracidiphilus sp.]
MAEDTARCNWPVEAEIGELISRRRRPFHRLGIKRQGRLKKKIVFSEDCAISINSRTYDPINWMRGSEALFSIDIASGFALKELSILEVDFESAVEPLIHIRSGGFRSPEKSWGDLRHGMPHARLQKSLGDF